MNGYPWLDKKEDARYKEQIHSDAAHVYQGLIDCWTNADIVQIAKALRIMAQRGLPGEEEANRKRYKNRLPKNVG